MKNKTIIYLLLLFLAINGTVYSVSKVNGEKRIQLILDENQKTLQTHYDILLKTQENIAKTAYQSTIEIDKVIQIISQAKDATQERQAILRDELYGLLDKKYKILKQKNVLQYQFVFPNNKSFLRMHNPHKFGDDITDIRADFKYVNKTKKVIRTFAQGRSAHGFRNVFPFFNKTNEYIGAIEISFSSEYFQWYLNNISGIHSHFLVDKNIFSSKAWEKDNLVAEYSISAENPNYMITLSNLESEKNCIANNMQKLEADREEINNKMLQGEIFTIYVKYLDDIEVISFLPINDLNNKKIAWLVSYQPSTYILSIIKAIFMIRVGALIFSIILIYFIFLLLRSKEKLIKQNEVTLKLNERIELALLGNHDGVFDLNLIDNSVYYSPRWKEMLGYCDDELSNELSTWESLVHPDDRDGVWAEIQKHIDGEIQYYDGVHRLKHKDGYWVWIHARAKAIFDESGKAVRMIGTHTDISAEKEIQFSLQKSNDLLEKLSNNIPAAIYQYQLYPDGRTCFPYASIGIEDIYEVTPKAIMNDAQAVFDILHPDDFNMIVDSINKSAQTMKDWNLEYRVKLPKKGIRWLHGQAKPQKLEDGSILWHGFIDDITERKTIESKLLEQKNILHYQANHDSLTGLANRVLFNDRLKQTIEKAKRRKSNIALLFIDLDHFKEINDSLGHAVGDEILKVVTSRLKQTVRGEDTLARLGGDEFTIILEDLAQGQDASLLAQKIINILSEVIIIEDHELYISSSIGISLYPNDGGSASNLLKYADSAMYKAKDNGRNNFQFYSAEMTELAFERVVMEAALRAALQNEEFLVYYQPQVDATTNSLTGMEALVRWQHPIMGLVSPAKFIPLAENTGLIVEIDQYVMRTAMTQMVKWINQGLFSGIMYMNLAAKQLQKKDFIEILENLMKETGCEAKYIGLEVTESQIMINPEEAIVILKGVSSLGIELAVDDFGTGYSSLSYLKKLPIDKLKIDQSFVRDLPDDEEDAAITRAVIALAKSLNLKIIAEGVETKEQKDFIVENSCKDIQGYYYSKPVSACEFEVILRGGVK